MRSKQVLLADVHVGAFRPIERSVDNEHPNSA